MVGHTARMSPCRIGPTDRGHYACALPVQRFSPTPILLPKLPSIDIRFLWPRAYENHSKRDFSRQEPAKSLHPFVPCRSSLFRTPESIERSADAVYSNIDSFGTRSIVVGTRRGRRPAAFPPLLPPSTTLLLIRETQTPRLFPLSRSLYGLFIPSPLPNAQHSSYSLFACSSADER